MAASSLNESIEDSISEFCGPYCQPETNQLGFCPKSCISVCYPICNRPFLAAIPPFPPVTLTPDVATNTLAHGSANDKEHSNAKAALYLTFFLAILVIAFSIFLCYAINKFCKAWSDSRREEASSTTHLQRQHQQESPHPPPAQFLDQETEPPENDNPIWNIRTVGLQPSEIEAITIIKYKKGGADDRTVDGTDCAVCLNNFQEDETLRLLPKCNHAFHIQCIDTWLNSHKNCPICRSDIVLPPPVGSPSSPQQNAGDSDPPVEGSVEETEGEPQRGGEDDSMEPSSIEHDASSGKQ